MCISSFILTGLESAIIENIITKYFKLFIKSEDFYLLF